MSAPASVDEFLTLVRRSELVEEARLDAYLHGRIDLPADATVLAQELVRDGLITDFQREQFLLGKWRGFTLGKYRLLERIGAGGMGQVFLAEHTVIHKRVAVKVLPPARTIENPGVLGRFYREARAAGLLNHPHIVRTHDIDQDGDVHFIVMEHVDGANLLEVVRVSGPLPVGRACHYIRQTALGLDFAFRNGIIHRDVKPGNILIDRSGTAKLLDMGLAKFYRDTSDLLTVKYDGNVVLGTADYVAPEQVLKSAAADTRSDIYALGGTLYYVLAGHPPFPTGTVNQKLTWHRTQLPTPIRDLRPDVPEELAAALGRMMAKDPAQRYQTPAAVAAALEAWVPGHVPPPTDAEMPKLCPAVAAHPVEPPTVPPASHRPALIRVPVRPPVGPVPPSPFAPVVQAEVPTNEEWGGAVTPANPPPAPRAEDTGSGQHTQEVELARQAHAARPGAAAWIGQLAAVGFVICVLIAWLLSQDQ